MEAEFLVAITSPIVESGDANRTTQMAEPKAPSRKERCEASMPEKMR